MNTPQVERTSRYVVVVDGRVSGRISGAFPHVRCRAYVGSPGTELEFAL